MTREPSNSTAPAIPIRYRKLVNGLLWAALVLLPLGLFVPIVWYDLIYSWDDGVFVADRVAITAWTEATWEQRILTPELGYPLPFMTGLLALLHTALGDAYVPGLRVTAIVGHLAATFIGYFFVRRFFPEPRSAAPLLGMLFWTVHPAMVETLAWATNIKTLLATITALTALLFWDRWVVGDGSSKLDLGISLAALIVAFGSRPEAGVIPGAMLAIAFLRSDGDRRKSTMLTAAPLLILGAGCAYLANSMHDEYLETVYRPIEIEGQEWISALFESFGFYLERLAGLWESTPRFRREYVSEGATPVVGAVGAVAALVGSIVLLKRDRRDLLALLTMAAVFYVPFSNLIPLPRYVADTYLYLPGLFLVSFAAASVTSLQNRWVKRAAAIGALLLTVYNIPQTANYVPRWASTERLFSPEIERYPADAALYSMIAQDQIFRGNYEKSRTYLDRGMKYYGAHPNSVPFFAPAIFDQTGSPEKAISAAIAAYRADREIEPELGRATLDILIERQLPLPRGEGAEELLTWSIKQYAERPHWFGGHPYETSEAELRSYLKSRSDEYLALYDRTRTESAK